MEQRAGLNGAGAGASSAFTFRNTLVFSALFFANLVLSTRAAMFLHEALGHAATALLLGGDVLGVQVSLFGGGRVHALLPDAGEAARFAYAHSGMLVNAVSGLAALALFRARRVSVRAGLFACLFASVSILGALFYFIVGAYHGQGDPATWAAAGPLGNSGIPCWYRFLWIPLLGLAPYAGQECARAYLMVQERLFPAASSFSRLKISLAGILPALLLYTALCAGLDQELFVVNAASLAHGQAVAEKRMEAVRTMARWHPDWGFEKVTETVDKLPVKVPRRFPLLPPLVVLTVLGGCAALAGPYAETRRAPPGFREALAALGLAVCVVGVLWVCGTLVPFFGGK
jgi:hypothetical protein